MIRYFTLDPLNIEKLVARWIIGKKPANLPISMGKPLRELFPMLKMHYLRASTRDTQYPVALLLLLEPTSPLKLLLPT